MFKRLFTSADGKIPFLQIIIGIVLGAISMFAYCKFCKPKLLFGEKVVDLLVPEPAAAVRKNGRPKNILHGRTAPPVKVYHPETIVPPVATVTQWNVPNDEYPQ